MENEEDKKTEGKNEELGLLDKIRLEQSGKHLETYYEKTYRVKMIKHSEKIHLGAEIPKPDPLPKETPIERLIRLSKKIHLRE